MSGGRQRGTSISVSCISDDTVQLGYIGENPYKMGNTEGTEHINFMCLDSVETIRRALLSNWVVTK